MSEETPLVRQWILLRKLSALHHGVTVKEMADDMGVSEKTIRRDLESFQQAGFPLAETVEEHGRKKWHVNTDRSQPGLSFALDEAIALYLARHLMEPLAGTMFWEAIQRAFRKIRAALAPQALKYVGQLGVMFHQTKVGTSDYAKKAELIDELMIGIEDKRAVFIAYQSLRATEPVTYDIYPYGLAYHRGSLYLIGFAPDHREIRHWKVDRIEEAEVTPVHFNRPEDFDLRDHLAKSFGVFHGEGEVHVKVRFSPGVVRYVTESKWHSSQHLTPQKDGSLIAEFDLGHTEEIKRWIQSFGKHAVVLEPDQLRVEMIGEINALRDAYVQAGPGAVDMGRDAEANPSAIVKDGADELRRSAKAR
ncbi:MAG: helix-turn-helix transcriptional regulator [Pirellulaceae bacterium]